MSKFGFSADSHSVTRAVMFLLISLFAVLALIVAATGVRAYSGVNASTEKNARERAALNYVVNRVRAADASGCVNVAADGKSVELTDNVDGEEFATRIYCANGRLMEYFGYYADEWDADDGETITEAQELSVSREADGVIRVNVVFADGSGASMRVALRSAD